MTETPEDVGGLEVLKDWLRLRERAFTQEARDYGLPAPKGIALIGIPGTGKSLTAKMIGGLWRLPLLRLDVGALSAAWSASRRSARAARCAWPRRSRPACSGSTRWRRPGPRRPGQRHQHARLRHHPHLDAGEDRARASWWPRPTTSPACRRSCCARAASTRSSSSTCPPWRSARRSSPSTCASASACRRTSTRAARRERSQGYVGAEIEQAIIDAMYVGFNDAAASSPPPISRGPQAPGAPVGLAAGDDRALRDWLREGRAQSASFEEIARGARNSSCRCRSLRPE